MMSTMGFQPYVERGGSITPAVKAETQPGVEKSPSYTPSGSKDEQDIEGEVEVLLDGRIITELPGKG